MNDKEKLKKINEIAGHIWDWMCSLERSIVTLIPPIEKIRELSAPVDARAKNDMTTIQIGVDTRDILNDLKIHPREPYQDVIKRVLWEQVRQE